MINVEPTESYTANVSYDNNDAKVILDLHANGNAVAKMDSKSARRIAIRLLQAADAMDDQAKVLAALHR
jgi:hypothetical protein